MSKEIETISNFDLINELKRRIANPTKLENFFELTSKLESITFEAIADLRFMQDYEKDNLNYQLRNLSNDLKLSTLEVFGELFDCYGYVIITKNNISEAINFFVFMRENTTNKSRQAFISDLVLGITSWSTKSSCEFTEKVKILTDRKSVAIQSSRLIGNYIANSDSNVLILSYLDKTSSFSNSFLMEINRFFRELKGSTNCIIEFIGDETRVSRIKSILNNFLTLSTLNGFRVIVGSEELTGRQFVEPNELSLANNRLASAKQKLIKIYALLRGFKLSINSLELMEILTLDIKVMLQYNSDMSKTFKFIFRKIEEKASYKDRKQIKAELLKLEAKNGNSFTDFKELEAHILAMYL